MSAGALVALALGVAIAAAVGWPLLRSAAPADARREERLGRARELYSRRDMLLAALKDLDDDHATDKMSDEDHAALKARLTDEALAVLREIDALDIDADEPPQLRLMDGAGRPARGGRAG